VWHQWRPRSACRDQTTTAADAVLHVNDERSSHVSSLDSTSTSCYAWRRVRCGSRLRSLLLCCMWTMNDQTNCTLQLEAERRWLAVVPSCMFLCNIISAGAGRPVQLAVFSHPLARSRHCRHEAWTQPIHFHVTSATLSREIEVKKKRTVILEQRINVRDSQTGRVLRKPSLLHIVVLQDR
jgi:hypothetical protein